MLGSLLVGLAIAGPLAAVALFVLARRGWLSPPAFNRSPARPTRIGLIDVAIAFALFILGGVAASVLMPLIAPGDAAAASPEALATTALVGQVFAQGPVVALALYRAAASPGGLGAWGLPARPLEVARDAGRGGLLLLALIPIVIAVNILFLVAMLLAGHTPPATGHQMLDAMRNAPPDTLAALLLSAIVIAPILEEVIFRGLLQTALLRALGDARRWAVVGVAAAVFMLAHGSVPWHAWPALFLVGLILGTAYERWGSLWAVIIAHMGFNAFNCALVMIMPEG